MTAWLEPERPAVWFVFYAVGLATSHQCDDDGQVACVAGLVTAAHDDCARLETAVRLLDQMEIVDPQLRAEAGALIARAASECVCGETTVNVDEA